MVPTTPIIYSIAAANCMSLPRTSLQSFNTGTVSGHTKKITIHMGPHVLA
ncbi:hypothetical protein M7I_2496 [Glarea lozoyensis 74030]|uniref:Uncharacterized protein n=1 Tax=Glarea lozoyensis (strain ATCC 74030 / MF5533) TaxID=1104152 RepID=H0EIX7_GLAL7|nr:hypothetical protein M7I_2496 [Glarea lozoyensis 74030]